MTRQERHELCGPHERLVCRRRAARLRRRGDGSVRWVGWTPAGATVYAWSPRWLSRSRLLAG